MVNTLKLKVRYLIGEEKSNLIIDVTKHFQKLYLVKKRTVGKICSSLGRYIGREAVIEHDYEKKVAVLTENKQNEKS